MVLEKNVGRMLPHDKKSARTVFIILSLDVASAVGLKGHHHVILLTKGRYNEITS